MDDVEAIDLRPVGRKGLTSLRFVQVVLMVVAAAHLGGFLLAVVAWQTGHVSDLGAAALAAWELGWAAACAWGMAVASEEIADYQPGWVFNR